MAAEKSHESDLEALEAMRALSEVLGSGVLSETSRQGEILRYLVNETVEGRGASLKAYSIGIDVLGRSEDFNPANDSIVRVEMNRLRKALAIYNAAAKPGDIIIEIPKGQYQPLFIKVGADEVSSPKRRPFGIKQCLAASVIVAAIFAAGFFLSPYFMIDEGGVSDTASATSADGVTLVVGSFETPSTEPELGSLAEGLRQEIAAALSRNKSLAVSMLSSSKTEPVSAGDGRALAGFMLEGSVWKVGEQIRFYLRLLDMQTGTLIWAENFERGGVSLGAEISRIGANVASELRARVITAAKKQLESMEAESLSAWELYVRATWVPGEAKSTLAWEQERVALARRALELDPELGQAHSVLADKMAFLANVDPFSDKPELREEAAFHARRAMELRPDDADVVFNVSIHAWHAGNLSDAVRMTQRTLDLDPSHILAQLHLKVVPYTCARPPDDVLTFAILHDDALAKDNPVRWVTLTWISLLHLNRGEYLLALHAARRSHEIFHTPDTVYRMAAILTRLKKYQEAADLIDSQRANWPTLNPAHYASVAMARRCGSEPEAEMLKQIYSDMAENYARYSGKAG